MTGLEGNHLEYSLLFIEGKELCFVERAGREAVRDFKKDKSRDHLMETFGSLVRVFPLFESLEGNLILAYDLRRNHGVSGLMPIAVLVNLTDREVVVEVRHGGRVGRLTIEGDASVVRRTKLEFF
jgi:hypothetical protein